MYDAVCINIERNFNLRNTTPSRCDTIQTERTQLLVILCKFPFALQNVDIYSCLVIRSSRENLALLGRDGGISFNNLGANTAHGFQTQRQRGYIQQQQTVLNIAAEDTALICCTQCNAFIRINALERFFAQHPANSFLYSRDSGRTTNHQNLVQFRTAQTTVRQCLLYRTHGCFNQILGQFVELCNGQSHIQMLRASCISSDERQVDVGRSGCRQFNLCLFCGFLQTLHNHLIGRKVNAFCLLKFRNDPVNNSLVEVITAEVVVTSGSQYLLNTVTHFNDGYIERTTAEVVNHNLLVIFLINTIRKCCCGRFVDDSLYGQACNLSCILGCLTLCIGEVCRNSDNSFCYWSTQISFCICFQLLQNHCGDFLRSVLLAVNFYLVIRTHVTLDGGNGAFRIGNCLPLCNLTNQTFAVLGETNNRWGGSCTFCVRDYDCVTAFHNSNTRVCCTQVNTNNLSHNKIFLSSFVQVAERSNITN